MRRADPRGGSGSRSSFGSRACRHHVQHRLHQELCRHRVRPATSHECSRRLRDRQPGALPRRPGRLRDFARGVRRATRPRQAFRTNYKHVDIPKKIRHHHGQRHRAPPPRPPRPSRHIHCLPTGKHIWRGDRQATRSPDARNGVQIDGAATRRGKLIFIIFDRITCKKRT